jgi:small-conductance mechanosensitive channel
MDPFRQAEKLLRTDFLGTPLQSWLTALVVLLGIALALLGLRRALHGRLGRLLGRIPGQFDDVLVQTAMATHAWFIWMLALYVSSQWLALPGRTEHRVDVAMILLGLLQAGLWAQCVLRQGVALWTPAQPVGASGTASAAFKFLGNLLIWSLVLLLALQNLGVKIGALLAGLGVGGIAAALALQTVMGDLFASLAIFTDRPFDLGDFIVVGEYMGNVNKIGLRTTRLTSLGGEQIVLPNGDLMKSRIRNYRRMQERRVVNLLHVSYATPVETLRRIPSILGEAVQGTEHVRFDRVHFASCGEWSLQFELVYYVQSADYNLFMDAQQSLNFEIMRRFREQSIAFAFPTRTLHVHEQANAEAVSARAASH